MFSVCSVAQPSYSVFSVWVRKGQARLVMARKEGESVYQLDKGEVVTERCRVSGRRQNCGRIIVWDSCG